jgi:pSer/pThr/pTyr-binding forkhead associated (FHA) protein
MAVYTCLSCSATVFGTKGVCEICGARLPTPSGTQEETPVQEYQPAESVTLTVVKKDGTDGASYTLVSMSGTDHIIGKSEGDLPFPDDPWMSPRHAKLYWKNRELWVADLESEKGIYLRLNGPISMEDGDLFLAGEQTFRFQQIVDEDSKKTISFRVTRLAETPDEEETYESESGAIRMGRENGEIVCSEDPFMSRRHCQVHLDDQSVLLSDLGSRNGTYVRMKEASRLGSNDFFFVGQKLFRVAFD